MTLTRKLETAAKHLPPPVARAAKRLVVYPRYAAQTHAARRGFREFGDRYPNPIVFVAGLPKSGTTWLEGMIASYPGFHAVLIPDVAAHELSTGGSHDYELPAHTFARMRNRLVVTKMHVHGSPHNVEVLRSAAVPYVVLYRDLRDVAVSHVFYVRQTPWHAEYPLYAGVSPQEGLVVFAGRTLEPFADWIRSWHENGDPRSGLIVRYEELIRDDVGVMTRVAGHLGLDGSPETVGAIVEQHRFQRSSGGRAQGESDTSSFFRKGVVGDWKNHFTPAIEELYAERVGDFLREFGYDQDMTA